VKGSIFANRKILEILDSHHHYFINNGCPGFLQDSLKMQGISSLGIVFIPCDRAYRIRKMPAKRCCIHVIFGGGINTIVVETKRMVGGLKSLAKR
jgi:hypothetical protein